jgi:uncharacterized protein
MVQQFATPGVYIQEITGPGVIAGVGTSTAAFIGPAPRGPMREPRRITSFDEFIGLYGGMRDGRPWPYFLVDSRMYHMALAVEGFFLNGGQYAYIVRIGLAAPAALPIQNQAGEPVFVIRARNEGAAGDGIEVETQQSAINSAAAGAAEITDVAGASVTVDTPDPFRFGDFVTTDGTNRAEITEIQDSVLTLNPPLGAAVGDTLRIANILPGQTRLRMESVGGLSARGIALLEGDDADNPGNSLAERLEIQAVDLATNVVTLSAGPAGTFNMATGVAPSTLTAIRVLVRGEANITAVNGTEITVDSPEQLRPFDVVTVNGTDRAQITRIQGSNVMLEQSLPGAAVNQLLRIADVTPTQMTFRLLDTRDLSPGTVVSVRGDDADNPGNTVQELVEILAVDSAGFVTLSPTPVRANSYNMDVAAGNEPILIPQEFRLVVTPPVPATGAATPQRFEMLSLNRSHPRFILDPGVINSTIVEVQPPESPPVGAGYPARLVAITGSTPLAGGQDEQPALIGLADYQVGLNVLRTVEDANMVCVPDAATNFDRVAIQQAMIRHCRDLYDRVAILDPMPNSPPAGPDSVELQREDLIDDRGFAIVYYPWIEVPDPLTRSPNRGTMFIPPSGHMAGVLARTDSERGVHKAPANTDVRGALGVQRRLNDEQQGPLNLLGVNVLRVFPGDRRVIAWGARTTTPREITDWRYVSTRRLMLFLEGSIEAGIRWAVFEPNNQSLWKSLERTISEFLTRVWRDGALFGATAEQAFRVRIDEGLNPPSTQALGQLYIEISVRPSYPAEFVIVRIGLWDGGAEVSES